MVLGQDFHRTSGQTMQNVALRVAGIELGVGTLILRFSGHMPQIGHRPVDGIAIRIHTKPSGFVKKPGAGFLFGNDSFAAGGSGL